MTLVSITHTKSIHTTTQMIFQNGHQIILSLYNHYGYPSSPPNNTHNSSVVYRSKWYKAPSFIFLPVSHRHSILQLLLSHISLLLYMVILLYKMLFYSWIPSIFYYSLNSLDPQRIIDFLPLKLMYSIFILIIWYFNLNVPFFSSLLHLKSLPQCQTSFCTPSI